MGIVVKGVLIPTALLGWAITLVGCGDGAPSPGGQTPAGEGASASSDVGPIRHVALSEIATKASNDAPLLDEGRVIIAVPDGWQRSRGRIQGTVILFHLGDPNKFPRIVVRAVDSPSLGMSEVTAENVVQFSQRIAEQLRQQRVELTEPPIPMIIGDRPCVRYVIPIRSKIAAVERQVVKTLWSGRLYTVDLEVIRGTLRKHRDAAYAVVASMKFADDRSESSEGEPSGEPSDSAL